MIASIDVLANNKLFFDFMLSPVRGWVLWWIAVRFCVRDTAMPRIFSFFKGALPLDSETIGEFWKDGKVMGIENNLLERQGWWKTEAGGWKQAEGKQQAESWEMKHSNHSYRSPPPFHWFIPHRSSIVTQAGCTKKSPCNLSAQEEFKQTRDPWC